MALYDKAPIVAQHCTYFILLVQCNVYVYPEDLLHCAHPMLAVFLSSVGSFANSLNLVVFPQDIYENIYLKRRSDDKKA